MRHDFSMRAGIAATASLLVLMSPALAAALTPNVAWQVTGAYAGPFSSDGGAVVIVSSVGFQLRRASDGATLGTISLPATSRSYDAYAFSPNKQLAGITLRADGVTRIEIWNFASGALVRTINTDAVRNGRGLDISSSGLVAFMERFAYGGGGVLRVYRISDGALLHREGPVISNSSTRVSFSPNSSYLAFYKTTGFLGTVLLNTSNFSTALQLGNNSSWLQWTPDSSALWLTGIPYQRVSIPSGSVLQSAPLDLTNIYVSAVAPNNSSFLASQVVSTNPDSPPGNELYFLRASNGSKAVTYTFNSTIVSGGKISPLGTQFGYSICPTVQDSCTAYIAAMPAL